MRRVGGTVQFLFGNKIKMLEPYTSSLQIYNNLTSTAEQHKSGSVTLPKLPVPQLEDTLNKYLKTVRPHLSDVEYEQTEKLVQEFGAKGGEGHKLQQVLEARAKQKTNWLEEWWLTTAYLKYRDPVVVYSSPGLVFPYQKFNSEDDQIMFAARTLKAAMEYKLMIDTNQIPTEKMGKNPLDMDQYKKIFGTCRMPGLKEDSLSYNGGSKYVTVMHNGRFFHLDLWGADGLLLSVNQIAALLNNIKSTSSEPSNNPIGILSSNNRDSWGAAYAHLIKDPLNKESLRDIEKSLAVLCLDKAVGLHDLKTEDQRLTLAGAQTVHGGGSQNNGANRWFDKTVQFIVGADGVTGLTYEHSPAEGQPIAVLTDFIMNYVNKKDQTEAALSKSPKEPFELKFNVDTTAKEMITGASENLDKLVRNLEMNCFSFSNYGKEFIKSQKLSPDSFIQMAMQYAFYRLHSVPAAHYESAATRMYQGGRTETIRSCSSESVEFAQVMLNPKKTHHDKIDAMKRAINAHKDYTVMALQGLGVDRHLLGLKLAAIEAGQQIPKLYSDLGFVRSAHMRLSTSQDSRRYLKSCQDHVLENADFHETTGHTNLAKQPEVACKCDGFMVYGPLVDNGYATCYNPRSNNINFGTTAFASNTESKLDAYRSALQQSLQDMHDVLLLTTTSKL